MTVSVNMNATINYVAKDDREFEDGDKRKPMFVIRPLSAAAAAEIDDSLLERVPGMRKAKTKKTDDDPEAEVTAINVGRLVLETLRRGLVRVENLHDADGNPILWQEKKPDYDLIPEKIRNEVSNAIRTFNKIAEEERKNLELEG